MSQEELTQLEQKLTEKLTPAITARVQEEFFRLFPALASMVASQQVHENPSSAGTMGSTSTAAAPAPAPTPTPAPAHTEDVSSHCGQCELWVEDELTGPRLVALGSVHEGASTIHSVPLAPDFVRVVVEEIRDADGRVPVPTDEVQTVGQALQTFIAWPKYLVRSVTRKVCNHIVIEFDYFLKLSFVWL